MHHAHKGSSRSRDARNNAAKAAAEAAVRQQELERLFEEGLRNHVRSEKKPEPEQQKAKRAKPLEDKPHKGYTVVHTVRKAGESGLPKRHIFKAPLSALKFEAEHLARLAIRKAGLMIYCHIETLAPD